MAVDPAAAYDDVAEYVPTLVVKRQLDDDAASAALELLRDLPGAVRPVAEDVYESRREEAPARIKARDPDDWPILATALVLDCPIWTEDQDFFGAGVPDITTFLVMRRVGPAWDASLPMEEQSDWPAHADYIDELVENGVVVLRWPAGRGASGGAGGRGGVGRRRAGRCRRAGYSSTWSTSTRVTTGTPTCPGADRRSDRAVGRQSGS